MNAAVCLGGSGSTLRLRPAYSPQGGELTRSSASRNQIAVKLVWDMTRSDAAQAKAEDPLLAFVRHAVSGDRAATRHVVENVAPAMLRAIRKVMGHMTTEVEDVLQESLEGFLGALPGFKGQCTVTHFACRISVLTALASRRKAGFRAQFAVDAPDAADAAASFAPSPHDGACARQRRELLGQLLDDLPAAQAEVLVLHCALGFTVEEVASSLGRPLETVRSRIRLAKQALRERIGASPEWAEIMEVRR